MAKSQHHPQDNEPQASAPLWTTDDIVQLSSNVDSVGSRLQVTEQAVKDALEKLLIVEGQVALLDPTKATIPVEITKNINLGSVYNSAIAAGFQALMITQPQIILDSKFRKNTINSMLDTVDVLIATICTRHGVDPKTKIG